tara:strand:- start:1373 stop:1714 length:342 start_codon:yes stop_codon:yes gene_type:complete
MDIKINHNKIENTVTVDMKVPLLSKKAPKSERKKYKTNFILDFVKKKGYDIDGVMKKDTVLNFVENGNTGTWKFKLVEKVKVSHPAPPQPPRRPPPKKRNMRKTRPNPTPKED